MNIGGEEKKMEEGAWKFKKKDNMRLFMLQFVCSVCVLEEKKNTQNMFINYRPEMAHLKNTHKKTISCVKRFS